MNRFAVKAMQMIIILALIANCTACLADEDAWEKFTFEGKTYIINGDHCFLLQDQCATEPDIGFGYLKDNIVPLYADKNLIYYNIITSTVVFSLPEGYGTCYCNGYAACSNGVETYIIDTSGHIESEHVGYELMDNLFCTELPFVLKSMKRQNEFSIYNPLDSFFHQIDIKPGIVQLESFHEGVAWFENEDKEKGFINTKGELLIKGKYNVLTEMWKGYAFAQDINHTWIVIDPKGEVSLPTHDQENEIAALMGYIGEEDE